MRRERGAGPLAVHGTDIAIKSLWGAPRACAAALADKANEITVDSSGGTATRSRRRS